MKRPGIHHIKGNMVGTLRQKATSSSSHLLSETEFSDGEEGLEGAIPTEDHISAAYLWAAILDTIRMICGTAAETNHPI
jgi:hypothetical protein